MFEDIEKMGFAHFGIGAHEGSWTAGDNRYVNEFVEQFELDLSSKKSAKIII